ncbi:XRE family transcriptional regulator [Sphaerisporangium sp. NPDC051011]|uniref:helix-turn-helix domain-containing protein n=1 Tax=Sphaerisporangium sp. NPDC051011 TaxID=3155792 RepID=UPI0033D8EF07
MTTSEPTGPVFSRGNDRIDRLMADPEIAAEVAEIRKASEEMDRVYAMNLAVVRKAGQLTQVEVAKRLGVNQSVVSRMENNDDMLLSTLVGYLTATGAEGVAIVMTINGREVKLDLEQLRAAAEDRQSV